MVQEIQEEWEDLPEARRTTDLDLQPEEHKFQVSHSTTISPRRSRRKTPLSSPVPKSSRDRKSAFRATSSYSKLSSSTDWNRAIAAASLFTLNYVFENFRFALVILRKPLSLILVGYMLAILMSHLRDTFSTALSPTVAMLCQLPGVSRAPFCRAQNSSKLMHVRRADYPSLVDIQSTTFEQLLGDSIGGAGLALEIKKAEMATSDLKFLVRISHLTSKDRLAKELEDFVQDAKRTGRGLQRFSAKVGGAVDSIIAVNDYGLRRIEVAASADSQRSLWRMILSPFISSSSHALALTSSFKQAMLLVESELRVLILAAEASIHDLDTLEEKLNVIQSISAREDDSISSSKQELLSKLWTKAGGNRAELQRFDKHLTLLNGLSDYRKKALAHVVAALQTLQGMSEDLENLRERVSQPILDGTKEVSLEVHVKSIRVGLDRLTEGRLKAKKVEEARYAKLTESLGG